jgi:Periplasmic copper-binding protein (NosD)
MKLPSHHSLAALAAAFVTLLCAGLAGAAPWTINRPGVYHLKRDLSVRDGDGIVITASNVTLHLNGSQVSTLARGTGRGIVVQGAQGVSISGGRVGGFNANVMLTDSHNVRVDGLQITGDGLAPNNGPTEIGLLLVNSWGCDILNNTVTAVNLGVFVRGGKSTGNRIMKNVITGGATAANNLLGICYNPAPTPAGGTPDPAGPRGDSIYNNHIARFGFAIAVSAQSVSNMFNDNTLASFTGSFREPQFFAAQGGTNVEFDNTAVTIPATNL